ncbi:aliphatic sulfonate ABC transporter substrate-binding protein [Calothrix sp. PCC 7507]|uniref:aliphatic sulfonate ABC transporter substrate-binding protein n=1 Tax=Calothrix sp. PCC 7507 TaxID=99598 RepID=UPI00029EDE4C|nr:aliphatic sulfonate ABC transporter substrate-binding protein [Calothrix sp. PCC 7507]AFY34847.1 aliphatic sulfonates family ABC transporter, periplasmic ligand-binding protein [Calothrix sp. PCC 7507]
MGTLQSYHLISTWKSLLRVDQHRSSKTFLWLLIAQSCLSLIISGCTSSNPVNSTVKNVSNQSQNTVVAKNPESQKQTVVRIGYIKGSLSAIVKERGTLERELGPKNIKIEWVGTFPSFAPVLETINAKSSDLGAGGDIAGLSALSGGINACIIAHRPANRNSEGIVVHADSPIRTFDDLAGKKVIVNRGGISEHLLLKLLEKKKIAKEQVKRVYMKPDEALPAWASRHVDAWAVWDPWVATAELKYKARQIPLPATVPHYSLYMVHREAFAEKSAAIKDVIAILSKEAEWLNKHPQENQALYQKVSGLPPEVVKKTFERRPVDGVLPLNPKLVNELQDAADWLQQQGVVQKRVVVKDALCPNT